jgi:hypothetical protein
VSTSAPLPPDGGSLFDRITGGRRFASRLDASPLGDPGPGQGSRAGRHDVGSAGADSRWFDQNWENAPTSEELEGVAGMMGHRGRKNRAKGPTAPNALFDILLDHGPYQVVSFAERGMSFRLTAEDYLDNWAMYDYDPVSYPHRGRGGGVDANINPAGINPMTATTTTERARLQDLKDRLTVADVSSIGSWPAPITLAPTQTTNPKRPRTVAAGFDGYRKVLTVIFRDGTYYNYYGVGNDLWGAFVAAGSKGKFIRQHLDAKVRGDADLSSTPPQYRELLYRIARTAQVIKGGRKP